MYYDQATNIDRFKQRWNDGPVRYPEVINNYQRMVDYLDDRPCAIVEFFRNNPGQRVAMLSCNCPRCTIMC